MTYKRKRALATLLSNLSDGVEIHVYNDAAKREWPTFTGEQGRETIHHRGFHGGKQRYVEWFIEMLRDTQSDKRWRRLLILPDDVCPVHPESFFQQLEDRWSGISDRQKVVLNPLRTSRGIIRQWTTIEPIRAGSLWRVGWNDGCAYGGRRLVDTLAQMKPPDARRYGVQKPNLGSGLGRAISAMLTSQGFNLYQVDETMLTHGMWPSVMNPEARASAPLTT